MCVMICQDLKNGDVGKNAEKLAYIKLLEKIKLAKTYTITFKMMIFLVTGVIFLKRLSNIIFYFKRDTVSKFIGEFFQRNFYKSSISVWCIFWKS